MTPRILVLALTACACWAASDPVAARLAREAHEAQLAGRIVRAYLLYAQATAREPGNSTYRANRDSLAPAATLLTKANIENDNISEDVKEAERHRLDPEPPIELASHAAWARDETLQPLPHIHANASVHDFDIRTNEKNLIEQVTAAYGVRAICDAQLQPEANIRFEITQADFRTAMEALTAATHTFVFPISKQDMFFATDTQAKRDELEPNILLTFPLPDAMEQKDLVEAANAVRGVLNLRTIGWDSSNRTVMIRDRYTRAHVAESLLQALLLPKAQVMLDIQFLTFDTDRSYHYGLSLPTTFQVVNFGHLGGLQSILQTFTNPMTFLTFGGGASLFGIALTNAQLFATYSNSVSRHLYDAAVAVMDGQTANLHIGDKYPIPQTLYTGFTQSASSIYNPVPQFTLEDLGILLKLTPHVSGDGDVGLDVEADYKSLGTQTFNTVPAIAEREFKGSVSMHEGEVAVLAGMDLDTRNTTRNGLAGVSDIAGLNQLLSENTRETQTSSTLLVIKPVITRLPMSADISPQYLLGPSHGERVLL